LTGDLRYAEETGANEERRKNNASWGHLDHWTIV
jgi:hypothetical protein